MDNIHGVEVEFLILADYADVVNGKLYMIGGGWNQFTTPPQMRTWQFTAAAGLLIPWHEIGKEINVIFTVEDADGKQVQSKCEASILADKGSNVVEGQNFRAILTLGFTMQNILPGTYSVVAATKNESKRATFYVV